jgi:repressor LexA
MARGWTENRKKVAAFIENYMTRHGRAPSMDEIAEGTDLWKRSVEIVLKGLEKMGVIEITPGISRGIRLVEQHFLRVPLIGDVKAGPPAWAQEQPHEVVRLNKSLVPFKDPVALRVDGYSMKDAGIFPGDLVLVRPQNTASNGDTVIAYFNGGITVKKFEKRGSSIRLIPANEEFAPTVISGDDDFQIVGKVMLVLRDLGLCFDVAPVSADDV